MSFKVGESEVSAGYFIYTYSAGCCVLWQKQHFPLTEAAQALSCLYRSSSVVHAQHGKHGKLFFLEEKFEFQNDEFQLKLEA